MKSLKKYLTLILILCIGLFFTPDFMSILTYIYRLSVIGIIIVSSLWVFGEVDDWGIFPEINFSELISTAKVSPVGASIIFGSLIALISVIINAVIG